MKWRWPKPGASRSVLTGPPFVAILLFAWFGAVALLCCVPLLPRDRILTTQANDLANHVRLVYECGLALREGQFPPLVAPALEGGARVPVFQYYSGTAYLIPGGMTLLGLTPYAALKVAIFLHLVASATFVYRAARALGLGGAAALVAGTAYECLPFAGSDLISRGSYTEFLALGTIPLVFYCGLRLVQATDRTQATRWLCLTALGLAYFIPIHPIQTLLCGALVLTLLTTYALLDLRGGWPGPARLLAALAAGTAASAWYWVPLARDRAELRVSAHAALFDAGLASFKVLFWPTLLRPRPWPWGPQLGVHFALAAAAVVIGSLARSWPRDRPRGLGIASALSMALILAIIRWHQQVPAWLYHLLKPLQWTYRLMAPAALAGAVCLALALDWAQRATRRPWVRWATVIGIITYVVGLSTQYFDGQTKWYVTTPAEVVSDAFASPNTSSYALRGTNYRELALVRPDGSLDTSARIAIPYEGYPTEVDMVLRPQQPGADADVILGDPADPMDARNPELLQQNVLRHPSDPLVRPDVTHRLLEKKRQPDGTLHLRFSFVPTIGLIPGDSAVRFESRPTEARWGVLDVTFRRVGEAAERACRIPNDLARTRDGRRVEFVATVAPDRAGLYQLPVYFLATSEVVANGVRVEAAPTGNRSMTVVPLRAGRNVIKIRTRPTRPAAWVSGVTLCALLAGAAAPRRRGGERRNEDIDPRNA